MKNAKMAEGTRRWVAKSTKFFSRPAEENPKKKKIQNKEKKTN